jgi:hypothetical protein
MRFRATLQQVDGRWLATCLDMEASGEGSTRQAALDSLRTAIDERETVEAVAPPEASRAPRVELLVVGDDGDRPSDEPIEVKRRGE